MPEGKRAWYEGTKCPMAALLPEAIFNYVLTVEEYVFVLSVGFPALFAQITPPPPPTSYAHQFYDVMSGFTSLIMKTKYVCYSPISPHAKLFVNRLVETVI